MIDDADVTTAGGRAAAMQRVVLSPVELVLGAAALMEGIVEVGGANAGHAVERIQKRTGNRKGDAWCASYVAEAGAAFLARRWPLVLSGSCDDLLRQARKEGWLKDGPPAIGDVFLVMRTKTDAIHTGFVTGISRETPGRGPHTVAFDTIEGNTNPAGGREGYGVFRRVRGDADDRALKAGLWYAFIHWQPSVR